MKTLQDIAQSLQGYDPQSLTMADANAFIARLVQPLTVTERLPIRQCAGRVLAEDLVSPLSVPAHDNSAMDGFAFPGSALQPGQPLALRVAGTALAGKAWAGSLAAGECLKIMTGAILPPGLDTVVPQELTQVQGDTVTIPADVVRPGDNRRLRGEDLQQGGVALAKGELLAPAALGLAASLGLSSLPVVRRLKVAYLSTGDEVLSVGETLREGAVFDSNRYTVTSLLERMGCEVVELGVVGDDPVALEAAFQECGGAGRRHYQQRWCQRGRGRFHQGHDGQAGRRGVLAHCHAPGPPVCGGAHWQHRTVWFARQPGGGDGDVFNAGAARAAADDGRAAPKLAPAAGAQPGAAA